MTNENLLNLNHKNEKIYSLSIYKFIAMIMIVFWHIGNPSKLVDWGARSCEFLFVASGFLVGYNYYYKGMEDNHKSALKYVYSKIRMIFPLHIATLLAYMVINYKVCILNFKLSNIPILISNILLLQAWSSNTGG